MPDRDSTTGGVIWDDRISAYGRIVESQRRLHQIFDRSLRDNAGMSIVWYEALLRLGRSPDGHMPISELGEALGLTSGGATRLVDRLEETGYVERVACPTDRRVWWVALTDSGRTALDAASRIHVDDLDTHLVDRLDDDDLDTLNAVMTRIRPAHKASGTTQE
jgi:DNA-binding MarR family transcriptional regulator